MDYETPFTIQACESVLNLPKGTQGKHKEKKKGNDENAKITIFFIFSPRLESHPKQSKINKVRNIINYDWQNADLKKLR